MTTPEASAEAPEVPLDPSSPEVEASAGSDVSTVASDAQPEPELSAEAQLEAEVGAEEAPEGDGSEAGPRPEQPEEVEPLQDEAAAALGQALFALLFASPDTLSLGRLKDLTESPTLHVRQGLEVVEGLIEASGLPLVLKQIAGGYRLFSAPEVAEVVARLAKVRKAEQVTPAALETLSIVAYRQPTTKAEVEAIRGVQAGPMLRQLIDRGLVKVAGRADQPGAPLLYATTREFLDRFGLARLKDLPRDAELK